MEKKIASIKEKIISKKAKQNFDFVESKYAQNPIKSRFLAFQKTKKEIDVKDLF